MTKRAQRQALAEGLDQLLAGQPIDGDLLTLAAAVRDASIVHIAPALEEAHVRAALNRDRSVRSLVPRTSRRARPLAVGLAAAAMLVLMASSAVAASSAALPGEALYGVKRAVERVRLALPGGPAAKAQLHLEFADRRLSELQDLLARRASGEDVDVGAAMSAYRHELALAETDAETAIGQGRDDDAFIEHVLARLERHVQRLEFIRDNKVPEHARDAIQRAIDNAEKAKSKVGHGRLGNGRGGGRPDDVPRGGSQNAPGRQSAPGLQRAPSAS